MARKLRAVAAAFLMATTALAALPAAAFADDYGRGRHHRDWRDGRGHHDGYYGHDRSDWRRRDHGSYGRHHDYDHRRHDRDDDDDDAIVAGVVGLVVGGLIGAAIASSQDDDDRGRNAYDDRGPPPRAAAPACFRRERQWDPYAGKYVTLERRIAC